MKSKTGWLLLVIVWCSMIYLFTKLPYFSGESTFLAIQKFIRTFLDTAPSHMEFMQSSYWLTTFNFWIRKSTHFIVFGLLALLVWRTVYPNRFSYFIAWGFTTLFAAMDEWHQGMIPWRSPQISDVVIDSVGALAVLLFIAVIKRKSRRQGSP